MIIKITLLFLINVVSYVQACSPSASRPTTSKQKSNLKFMKYGAKDFAPVTLATPSTTSHEPERKQKKILNGEELNCNFEDNENCCWNNAPASTANVPLWAITNQDNIQKIKIIDYPANKLLLNGKFLSVTGNGPYHSQNSAEFVSCPIECSDLDVDVTIKYWLIGDANMKICTKSINFYANTPLSNCVELPKVYKRNRPFAEITLPAGENFQIVIVASNLKPNSTALIDDIKVSALPCMTSTSSTTTSTRRTTEITSTISSTKITTTSSTTTIVTTTESLSSTCQAVECDFEQSSQCSYKNMQNGNNKLFRQWEIIKGSFRNRLTGIRKAGEGRQYLATYLYPRDVAGIMTQINLPSDYVIRFLIYKSAQNLELMGCCQSLSDCPFSTEKIPIQKNSDYKKWRQEEFMCPKGTTKIIFYGYNIGENEGALGLDNIELLLPISKWTFGHSRKAC